MEKIKKSKLDKKEKSTKKKKSEDKIESRSRSKSPKSRSRSRSNSKQKSDKKTSNNKSDFPSDKLIKIIHWNVNGFRPLLKKNELDILISFVLMKPK